EVRLPEAGQRALEGRALGGVQHPAPGQRLVGGPVDRWGEHLGAGQEQVPAVVPVGGRADPARTAAARGTVRLSHPGIVRGPRGRVEGRGRIVRGVAGGGHSGGTGSGGRRAPPYWGWSWWRPW